MVDPIEEQIRRAYEEGRFENLPGKGKPLNLDENPFEDPEWAMAHRMLKEAGFSLPWIESRREIEAEHAAAAKQLQRAWEKRQAALGQGKGLESVQGEWQRAQEVFINQIAGINKLILSHNLQVPLDRFSMTALKAEQEIAQVTGHS